MARTSPHNVISYLSPPRDYAQAPGSQRTPDESFPLPLAPPSQLRYPDGILKFIRPLVLRASDVDYFGMKPRYLQ